jgi:hypothetical protein
MNSKFSHVIVFGAMVNPSKIKNLWGDLLKRKKQPIE